MLNWRPTLAFLLTVAFIVRGAASPPVPTPDNPSSLHYKAVLAAGDWSSPAFDHATEAVRDWLLAARSHPMTFKG